MDFCQIKEILKNSIGTPYYETDRCILFCGDSLVMQRKIDKEIFDAIITSNQYYLIICKHH